MAPKRTSKKEDDDRDIPGSSTQAAESKRLKTGTTEPKDSRNKCPICHKTCEEFQEGPGMWMKSDLITEVNQKSKKSKNSLEQFFQSVNALLNTQGDGEGKIFIHTEKAHLLGEFDKKIDDKLMKLIPDGSLYGENYVRYLYDKKHVVFNVRLKKTERPPSTNEFCTKVSLNKGVVDPTHAQVKRLIDVIDSDKTQGRPSAAGKTFPKFIKGPLLEVMSKSKEVVPFQESSNIQAKPAKNRNSRAQGYSIGKQLRIWWEEHNLPHYISAFSMQPAGGSILLGVREEVVNGKQTGEFVCQGPVLEKEDRKHLKHDILEKVHDEMYWSNGFKPEVVEVHFHDVHNGESGECVVEVEVSYYPGLSFFDKQGPQSYTLKGNEPSPYTKEDWVKLMSTKSTEM